MKLHKANKDEHEVLVEKYREKSLAEIIAIKPKWAYGEYIDDLYDIGQHPDFGDYKIFLVELVELIKNTEFFDFNMELLFNDKLESDYRVASTLERWEKNESVDPPTITIKEIDGKKLSISDGRHRTKLAYHLKQNKIPIAIHKSLIQEISNIIELEEP